MTPEGEKILRTLNFIEMFSELGDDQLASIASRFKLLRLEPWQPLFTDREAEEDFYIVQSGSVFVSGGEEVGDPVRIHPGEFFICTRGFLVCCFARSHIDPYSYF